jgi:hypothetical protein
MTVETKEGASNSSKNTQEAHATYTIKMRMLFSFLFTFRIIDSRPIFSITEKLHSKFFLQSQGVSNHLRARARARATRALRTAEQTGDGPQSSSRQQPASLKRRCSGAGRGRDWEKGDCGGRGLGAGRPRTHTLTHALSPTRSTARTEGRRGSQSPAIACDSGTGVLAGDSRSASLTFPNLAATLYFF